MAATPWLTALLNTTIHPTSTSLDLGPCTTLPYRSVVSCARLTSPCHPFQHCYRVTLQRSTIYLQHPRWLCCDMHLSPDHIYTGLTDCNALRQDYLRLMKTVFDFPSIKRLMHGHDDKPGFRVIVDCMNGGRPPSHNARLHNNWTAWTEVQASITQR